MVKSSPEIQRRREGWPCASKQVPRKGGPEIIPSTQQISILSRLIRPAHVILYLQNSIVPTVKRMNQRLELLHTTQ